MRVSRLRHHAALMSDTQSSNTTPVDLSVHPLLLLLLLAYFSCSLRLTSFLPQLAFCILASSSSCCCCCCCCCLLSSQTPTYLTPFYCLQVTAQPQTVHILVKRGSGNYVLFKAVDSSMFLAEWRNILLQHKPFNGMNEASLVLRLVRPAGSKPTEEEEKAATEVKGDIETLAESLGDLSSGRAWLLVEEAPAAAAAPNSG